MSQPESGWTGWLNSAQALNLWKNKEKTLYITFVGFSVIYILSLLHRNSEHFHCADERIRPAPLCRLPSSRDLTSWRAAGHAQCGHRRLVAHTFPSTLGWKPAKTVHFYTVAGKWDSYLWFLPQKWSKYSTWTILWQLLLHSAVVLLNINF